MNLTEWVIEHWLDVEADFAEFYGISDPLSLPWRRFAGLTSRLSPFSRTMRAIADQTSSDERPAFAKRIAARKGRGAPDRVVTPSEWMRGGQQ